MARAVSVLALAAAILLFAAAGVRGYNNGAGAKPPMGWNTWCTYDVCGLIDKCSDAEVRQQAQAMVAYGMDKLGYTYVNMDDCWSAKDRDANGNLQPNAERFPYGMKALADYVHSLGLKIGVYTCIGTHTCRNGLPGSYGHYVQDAATLASWGIDFVKSDNCNRPGGFTELELYTNFSRALNATGRPILFSLCEWGDSDVQAWGADVGQMYRIQMDHLPLYNLPTHAAGHGFGQGTKNIIQYIATLKPSSFVKQYGWMDPDFLMTLFWPTMTERYSKVELTLWTAWSAPMLVATQLSNMTAEKQGLLLNPAVIAINQDPSNTAADFVKNMTGGDVQLWARPLANGDAAVVIVNLNDYLWKEPGHNVTVMWSDFGITRPIVALQDLWAQAPVPAGFYNNLTYSDFIDASDVRYFRVTCTPAPCLP